MKVAILIGAALLGATGVAPAQADAQRYGYQDRYDGGGRDWRDDRGRRDDRGWRDGRRWGRGHRARSRVICRLKRGYYGPVRRCFRINR